MTASPTLGTESTDLAAVFAASKSLWEACQLQAKEDPKLNLSQCYGGIDGLMREVMRVAIQFEAWAIEHVDFENTEEVWPYLLEQQFGEACLAVVMADALSTFDEMDCLRVALQLNLPVRLREGLPVPVDVRAANPIGGSEFAAFRIQTVRWSHECEVIVPFTVSDDPFDDECGKPIFALYGVDIEGLDEHIADRESYGEALALARKLAPGINFLSCLQQNRSPEL